MKVIEYYDYTAGKAYIVTPGDEFSVHEGTWVRIDSRGIELRNCVDEAEATFLWRALMSFLCNTQTYFNVEEVLDMYRSDKK